jgi:methyl-accepting chemotaxis protein
MKRIVKLLGFLKMPKLTGLKQLSLFSGIAGKMLGFSLPLLLCLILAAVVTFYQNSSRIMQNNLKAKGQSLARTYAFNCIEGIKEGNSARIEAPMLGLTKEEDIVYVVVYNYDGTIAASYNKFRSTKILEMDTSLLEKLKEGNSLTIVNKMFDVYEPVKSQSDESLLESMEEEVIGFIRIGLSPVNMERELTHMLRLFSFYGLIALTIISALVIFMAGRMIKPIKSVANTMEEIGSGEADLTKRLNVTGNDEIGHLSAGFNSFAIALSTIIKQIGVITPQLEQESQSLAGASQQLTASTEEVSSTIQRISQSSEKQLRDIKQSAGEAQQAQQLSVSSMKSATQSKDSSERIMRLSAEATTEAIGLAGKIEKQANRISTLADSIENFASESRRISDILNVIDEVAQKTNLLALNAAIEAAHAGEYGKSFNVIAIEVRNLADMTKGKTDEITIIIDKLTGMVDRLTQESRSLTQEVRTTEDVLKRSAETLAVIAKDIGTSTVALSDIYSKGEANQRAINKVVALLEDLAREAESNAAAAEEVSAATEQQTASFADLTNTTQLLSTLSEKLKSIVSRFKV